MSFSLKKNDKNADLFLKIVVSAAVILCYMLFYLAKLNNAVFSGFDSLYVFIFSIIILIGVSFFFCRYAKLKDNVSFSVVLTVSAAAIILRLFMFNEISRDYTVFLSKWLETMRSLKGVEAITTPIGDYNMPYLYFLFGVSKIGVYDLYQIKLLSVLSDFVLALGIMKLTAHFIKSDTAKLISFSATLFIPTVFLNSAYWAQCDSIYAALSVWALYFALKKNGAKSIILFALAFSFKIQTIFILPIIIFLLLKGKISIKQLILFPVAFIITLLPALFCGRSIGDTISIYKNQTLSYPELTLNCPTLWAFFPEGSYDAFGSAALFLAGAAVLCFCCYLYLNRNALNDKLLIDAAFLFTLLMVFMLPKMHERYFYMSEVLCVVYIILNRKRFFAPPLIILTSFSCYSHYLFGERVISLEYSAIINLALIIYLFKKFTEDISHEKQIQNAYKFTKKESF